MAWGVHEGGWLVRFKRSALGGLALALFVVLAVSCGGDDDDKETTAKDGSPTTAASPGEGTKQATATSSSGSGSGKLGELLKDRAKKSFLITYSFESAGAQKGSYTIVQKPPKSATIIEVSGATIYQINDGTDTYSCTKAGTAGSCQK